MKSVRPEAAAFSERLRNSRLRAGYTGAREAARAFEWNENTYKSRENAIRGIPEYAEVRKYARAYKVPFIWLLTGEGDLPKWISNSDRPQVNATDVAELAPVRNNDLQDSDYIQVQIADLRKLVSDALQLEGIAEELAVGYAAYVIEVLKERPTASVVLRLGEPVRTLSEFPVLRSGDPA